MASTTFWDKQAKSFSKSDSSDLVSILSRVSSHIKPNYTAIDLGCGTGQGTLESAKYVRDIVGLDLSSEMIHYAKMAASEMQVSNVSFDVCAMDDYPVESKVDLITSFNLLHLVDDIDATIKSIHEHLFDGGYYISYTPCMGKAGPLAAIIKFISKLGFFPNIQSFTADGLLNILSSRGFKIISSDIDYEQVPQILIVAQKITL